jgi:hypothetical protein
VVVHVEVNERASKETNACSRACEKHVFHHPLEEATMSSDTLSGHVSRIISRLSDLPGSKGLSVHTRRYPRIGPAERSSGFEEHHWSMTADEKPAELAIPADAEDVTVTWLGMASVGVDQQVADTIDQTIGEAGGAMSWEYRVFTRSQPEDAPELVVEIFNAGGMQPN